MASRFRNSPEIKFHVFSKNNGECEYDFNIKLNNITWDSFITHLFGPGPIQELQLPTIILLDLKHKIVLRRTNFKRLIRDAFEESFKGYCVNLLIPDFEIFSATVSSIVAQRMAGYSETQKTRMQIDDFAEIFSKRYKLSALNQFVQTSQHVRFLDTDRDDTARVESPARENTPQIGELQIKRINDGDLVNLLKNGASLTVMCNNEVVSLKFYHDQLSTSDETQCKFRTTNLDYKCSYLKVPVVIDDEIKLLFRRDAEFMTKMSETMDTVEKNHQEYITRLNKFHEAAIEYLSNHPLSCQNVPTRRMKTVTELFSTNGVTTAATSSTLPESFARSGETTPSTENSHDASRLLANVSNLQSNMLRRSIVDENKTVTELFSTNGVTTAATSSTLPESFARSGETTPSTENLHDASRLLANVSNLQSNMLRRSIFDENASQGTRGETPTSIAELFEKFKSDVLKDVKAVIKDSIGSHETPTSISKIFEKFKNEVLKDVKALIKEFLDTSMQIPSTSDVNSTRLSHTDNDRHSTVLDGSNSSSEKRKIHDREHRDGGPSKKKSASLPPTTPLPSPEKVIDIRNDLFVLSKNGFKVQMPRNSSSTVQLVVTKSTRCPILLEDTKINLLSGSASIDCCITRASSPFGAKASTLVLKEHLIHHDICIRSKDQCGIFRLKFNIVDEFRIIGRPFKIDVHVDDDFTQSLGDKNVTLNLDNDELATPLKEISNTTQTTTTSAPNMTIVSQKSPAPRSNRNVSAAGAELADNGLADNQEDFFFPISNTPKHMKPAADGQDDVDWNLSISLPVDESKPRDVLVESPSRTISDMELSNDELDDDDVELEHVESTEISSESEMLPILDEKYASDSSLQKSNQRLENIAEEISHDGTAAELVFDEFNRSTQLQSYAEANSDIELAILDEEHSSDFLIPKPGEEIASNCTGVEFVSDAKESSCIEHTETETESVMAGTSAESESAILDDEHSSDDSQLRKSDLLFKDSVEKTTTDGSCVGLVLASDESSVNLLRRSFTNDAKESEGSERSEDISASETMKTKTSAVEERSTDSTKRQVQHEPDESSRDAVSVESNVIETDETATSGSSNETESDPIPEVTTNTPTAAAADKDNPAPSSGQTPSSHSLRCVLCGKQFKRKRNLDIHKFIHNGEKPFKCGTCGKRFSGPSSKRRHERLHKPGDWFECAKCGRDFSQKHNLKKHMMLQHRDKKAENQPRFKCDICGKRFFHLRTKNEHKLLHDDRGFECATCGRKFAQKYLLRRHIIRMHLRPRTQEKPSNKPGFKCEICDKRFLHLSYKNAHERFHDGQGYECATCGRKFTVKHNLREHIMRMHGDKKKLRFVCGICGRRFSHSHSKRRHELLHDSQDQFKCTTCDRSFYKKGYLKRHIEQIHKDEKPDKKVDLKCKTCGKRYSKKDFFEKHVAKCEKSRRTKINTTSSHSAKDIRNYFFRTSNKK